MRLLIYVIVIFIGYVLYKAARQALSKGEQVHRKKDAGVITAELVEDPVCHTYYPKNDALVAHYEGRTYYFCSEECRRKFMEERKGERA